MRESDLISLLQSVFPRFEGELGIGDDAAAFDPGGRIVITTDTLVEGVDFLPGTSPRFVALKAMAANLSDIAAMGARPVTMLLTIVLPSGYDAAPLARALGEVASANDVSLMGGDLSGGEHLAVSITMFGRPVADRLLLRSSARPGDRVYVSRPLGGAHAGLMLLKKGWHLDGRFVVTAPAAVAHRVDFPHREFAQSAMRRQLAPEAETLLGARLAELRETGGCIDVSDGLSTDLRRMCDASGVGAMIEWERIPQFPDLDRAGFVFGFDSEFALLHGGEEYALLFTSSMREAELSTRLGTTVYRIGRITRGPELKLERNGVESVLEPLGWDHFTTDQRERRGNAGASGRSNESP